MYELHVKRPSRKFQQAEKTKRRKCVELDEPYHNNPRKFEWQNLNERASLLNLKSRHPDSNDGKHGK